MVFTTFSLHVIRRSFSFHIFIYATLFLNYCYCLVWCWVLWPESAGVLSVFTSSFDPELKLREAYYIGAWICLTGFRFNIIYVSGSSCIQIHSMKCCVFMWVRRNILFRVTNNSGYDVIRIKFVTRGSTPYLVLDTQICSIIVEIHIILAYCRKPN